MTPRRRPLLVVSLVAAVAAGGFAFTYWVMSQQAGRSLRSEVPEPAPAARPPALQEVTPSSRNPEPAPRTTPDTLIVRRTYYATCGDEYETSRGKAGPELAGKLAEDLTRGSPHTQVEAFSAQEVDLLTTLQEACPRHAAQRYLTLSGGDLVESLGPPGGRGSRLGQPLLHVEVERLPDREVEELRRGIVITSDQQLSRILQSYADLAGSGYD